MNDGDFTRSPYLEFHGQDKVKWNIWGSDILRTAKDQDKPLFISIGYYTCHWCHMMQEVCFNDDEVASILNRDFIPVIVDREERPDIDDFYMKASQIMNGSGGWPLNVIAMPDGKPFFIATFLYPRSSGEQPGLIEILESATRLWKEERGRLIETSDEVLSILLGKGRQGEGNITYEEAKDLIYGIYDRRYGGFGSSPKFPNFTYLQYLITYDLYNKSAANKPIVERTISAILNGGIYDQVGGGIHRYSTDEKWNIPHFEKMLYDQAMLLDAITSFTAAYSDRRFLDKAREVINFLIRDMSKDGLFVSAIDSDFKGEEGLYYLWEMEELSKLLNEEEMSLFRKYFELSVRINNKIIIRRKDSPILKDDLERINGILNRLRNEREKRGKINKDDKIILSWNAMALRSILRYSYYDAEFLDFFKEAFRKLEETFIKENQVLRTVRGKKAGVNAQLEDYAYFTDLLLEMHQFFLDETSLNRAIKMAFSIGQKFIDPKGDGFFTVQDTGDIPIIRPKGEYDTIYPSGTSLLYSIYQRLFLLTGLQEMRDLYYSVEKFLRDSSSKNPMANISFLAFTMMAQRSYRLELREGDIQLYKVNMLDMQKRPFLLTKVDENINLCTYDACIASFNSIHEALEYIKKMTF